MAASNLASFTLLLLAGVGMYLLASDSFGRRGGLVAGLLASGLPYAGPAGFHDVTDADYTPAAIRLRGQAATTAREYEPTWVVERPDGPRAEPLTPLAGELRLLAAREQPTSSLFLVEARSPSRVRANTFYFPGWRLTIDGVEREVDHDNRHGLMEFSLEPGRHVVRLRFTDTPVREWAGRLSLLSLALLLSLPWLRGKAD